MKNSHCLPFACAALLAVAGSALADDHEDARYRWNLADLYADTAAWNADEQKVEETLAGLSACKGHLGDSAARLQGCLDLQSETGKRFARLSVYANELHRRGHGRRLEPRARAACAGARLEARRGHGSFVRPEVLRHGKRQGRRLLRRRSRLALYRHPMDDILRAAPHTLDAEGERPVAAFDLASGAGGEAYEILSNADMPWPTVKLSDGTEAKLDQAGYTKYREVANRADRKKVFDAFWGTFKEFERTFGVTFYSNLKEDTVYAKVRHYPGLARRVRWTATTSRRRCTTR